MIEHAVEFFRLEKELMETFPFGMTRFFPRMYRGLPRVYHRDIPSRSLIKQNFTDLAKLKKQIVSKALFSTYKKQEGRVVLFTWVMDDGLGDFTTALEVMHLLQEYDVSLVLLLPAKIKMPMPKNVYVVPYKDTIRIPVEALELMRRADFILQLPTYYPDTLALNLKMESVGEYGFLESSWFHPKTDRYALGLHFLEKGILIKKMQKTHWEEVQNTRLRAFHNPRNHFYLAYLATKIGGAIYLHALLKSLENDPTDIDICSPDLSWFIRYVEERKTLFEFDCNVAVVEVHLENDIHTYPVASQGKRLRLIAPGQIGPADFRRLLTLSSPFVAVRGNQSFSEAISLGIPFFYDAREHARYFLKDLVALAQCRLSSYRPTIDAVRAMHEAYLYSAPQEPGEWVDETFFQTPDPWPLIALKLARAIQDPTALSGFRSLSEIIAREHSANSFLRSLVNRGIAHARTPSLLGREVADLEQFSFGLIDFKQLMIRYS